MTFFWRNFCKMCFVWYLQNLFLEYLIQFSNTFAFYLQKIDVYKSVKNVPDSRTECNYLSLGVAKIGHFGTRPQDENIHYKLGNNDRASKWDGCKKWVDIP